MGFLIELGPHQRLIAGNCRIVNGDRRSRFFIEGDIPILRDNMILRLEEADTPLKMLYFTIQMAYLENDRSKYIEQISRQMIDLKRASVALAGILDEVAFQLSEARDYQALKLLQPACRNDDGAPLGD